MSELEPNNRATPRRILEVIVTSADEAHVAAASGADRLELIRDFGMGGLTPNLQVIQQTISAVTIPVRVMIRETESFELRDETVRKRIKELASIISSLEVDGLVMGFIHNDEVDTEALADVLGVCAGTKITFHRAFESTTNAGHSIDKLKLFSEIDRVLTNGGGTKYGGTKSGGHSPHSNSDSWGKGNWNARIDRLEALQKHSYPIKFLVGGEVDEQALLQLSKSTLHEFHIGRSVRTPETVTGAIDPIKIGKMRDILDHV